jgi:hypothetical protein
VVDVGRDAHAGEHLVAEPVRGGDGGGVEVGRRGGQPPPACVDLDVTALRQVADEVVGRTSCRVDVVTSISSSMRATPSAR